MMEKPYALSSNFGEFCFEDNDIIVESIDDGFPEIREDMHEVVGADGSVLRSYHLGPRTITLECRAFKERWRDFDRFRDELAANLLVGERTLALRNHFGEHYVAHLTGFEPGDREGGTGIGAFTLTFTASDPIRYGRIQEVTIPSGGYVEFDVAGTYMAKVSLSANAAIRATASTVWGVRFDEGDFIHLKIPTGEQSRVVVDCHDRSVKINGATAMITPDSFWPTLTPGSHVARMDQGTGEATLTWQERSV